MGREIEMKIPLTKKEYDDFYQKIYVNPDLCAENYSGIKVINADMSLVVKNDLYYSKYNSKKERDAAKEPQCIRIRTEKTAAGEASVFTLKRKVLQNGIEVNQEDETVVEAADVLIDFFSVAGYHCWFKKEKKAYSAFCESSVLPGIPFHVELETVNDQPYMEVEVTDTKEEADVVRRALEQFIRQLGLKPENRETKSWVDIILGTTNY